MTDERRTGLRCSGEENTELLLAKTGTKHPSHSDGGDSKTADTNMQMFV